MGIIKDKFHQSMARQEEQPYLVYFRLSNCPNLKAEPYSFYSGNNKLNGYFYYYDGYQEDVLVIFCHGIGGGHSSYLKEINELAKMGYRVLAYDNTGCVSSQGESIVGLSMSLKDLDNAIISLRQSGEIENKKIYVVGHSWGGFAASNIYNFQKVDKIVAISPFISIEAEYRSLFKGFAKLIVPSILRIEQKEVGKWAKSSAIKALNKEDVNALIIHSIDDDVVLYKTNTKELQKKIHQPNVQFYIVDGKGHHPQFTEEAVNYFNETFQTFNDKIKNKSIQSLEDKKAYFQDKDFNKMTLQDEKIWSLIEQYLKND